MTELSEDDVRLIVKAVDHYHAYLVATHREDRRYKDLAERLERKGRNAKRLRHQRTGSGHKAQ
jgi:hypothetical protein